MDEDATAAKLESGLKEAVQNPDQGIATLRKALEDAQAAQAAQKTLASEGAGGQGAPGPPPEPTIMGLTFGALFAGLVLSSIGIGFLVYAKSETQPLFFLFGIVLVGLPFFVTNTTGLVVAGLVLVLLPMLLKKYLYW